MASEYAPTLWFHEAELFGLILADFFITNSDVDDEGNLKLDKDDLGGAVQLQFAYYEWNLKVDNPVYFHAGIEEYYGENYIFVQYWFHYLYNYHDAFPNHEGEWEMIVVILKDDESIRNGTSFPEPYMVAYSHHLSGNKLLWTSKIEEEEHKNHPVVYVARGSHASYFTGKSVLEKAEEGLRTGYDELYLIDLDLSKVLEGIKGKWGGDDKSPLGPFYQPGKSNPIKWEYPVKWAMNLTSSTEFYLGSPAHMLITDRNGRRIGFLGDRFMDEIPDAYALVSDEREYYHLPLGEYSVVITAFEEGEIDFDIVVNDEGEATYIFYRDTPVSHSTVAYSDLAGGEESELRIDENGDGTIDRISAPDEIIEFKDNEVSGVLMKGFLIIAIGLALMIGFFLVGYRKRLHPRRQQQIEERDSVDWEQLQDEEFKVLEIEE